MNKSRRSLISKNVELLKSIKSEIEDALADEEMYFDSMPENLQGSVRGTESEEAIDMLSEAVDSLDSAIDSLESIV